MLRLHHRPQAIPSRFRRCVYEYRPRHADNAMPTTPQLYTIRHPGFFFTQKRRTPQRTCRTGRKSPNGLFDRLRDAESHQMVFGGVSPTRRDFWRRTLFTRGLSVLEREEAGNEWVSLPRQRSSDQTRSMRQRRR